MEVTKRVRGVDDEAMEVGFGPSTKLNASYRSSRWEGGYTETKGHSNFTRLKSAITKTKLYNPNFKFVCNKT